MEDTGNTNDPRAASGHRARLARAERKLTEIERVAHTGLWEWDIVSNRICWSDETFRIFGLDPERFPATYEASLTAVHPDDRDSVEKAVERALLQKQPFDIRHRIVRPDGTERVVRSRGTVTFADDGNPVRMTGTVQDVTEQALAEDARRTSDARYRRLAEALPDAVLVLSSDCRCLDLFPGEGGMPPLPGEQVLGRSIDEVHHPPEVARAIRDAVATALRERRAGEQTFEFARGDRLHHYVARFAPFTNDAVVVILRDVTGPVRAREEMGRQAMTDALTGLPNRRRLEAVLVQALREAAESNRRGAFVILGLDRFNLVNATYGDKIGDMLLRAVARTLVRITHPAGTMGRFAGDEFAVVLPDCTPGQARSMARQLIERVSRARIAAEKEPVHTTASAGVVVFPVQDASAEDLSAHAHLAMLQAKEAGRNQVRTYNPHRRQRQALARLQRARSMIVSAIEQRRLRLFRQPIVSIADRKLVMHEVLVRIEDEDGTIRTPGDFMPQAETLGLANRIDRCIIDATCKRWRNYADAGRELSLSVNISVASLGQETAAFLRERAAQSGVPPGALTVELTETAPERRTAAVHAFFHNLRAAGFRVAIDDFGSGHATLRELRHASLDYLKIDGSLVQALARSPVDHALVSAFTGVAHAMGASVIGEQVENAETLELLRECGVEYAQGYHLAKPEPFPPEPPGTERG